MEWRRKLVGKAQVAVLFAAMVFLMFAPMALGQTLPDPVRYLITPEVPGPNETVTVEIQAVGDILGSAEVTWSRNGEVVLSGVGERSYTFTNGSVGEVTTLRVTILSSQGTFNQTFTFNPSVVNLVWEAETTAPPFYQGKSLYSAGSNLTVAAFPLVFSGSSRVAESALSFSWSVNGTSLQAQSGLGRSTISFKGDQLRNGEQVVVDVYYGNSRVARGTTFVPNSQPQVLLYQRDPLRGVLWDRAFPAQGIALTGREITVQAQPYFFSGVDGLEYNWVLNGETISGPDSARGLLTLRQAGSGRGDASLSVSVENQDPNAFVQTANKVLRIVFGEQQTPLTSFFGL